MGTIEVKQSHSHYCWEEDGDDSLSIVASHQDVPDVCGYGDDEATAIRRLCNSLATRCGELSQRIHRDLAIVRSARELLRKIDVLPALPEHKTTPNGPPAAKDRA